MLTLIFGIYTVAPPPGAFLWLPALLFVLVAFTLGVMFVVSAVVVYFRDLVQAVPLVIQLGLFATPVAYGMEFIPERYWTIYAIINPLGPVLDGLRRTLLFHQSPDLGLIVPAAISATVWLGVGYVTFKRLETRFADVA
jgi:ABC-2 type transport system permease protein/lipopolysaccharide transport system permease protein